MRPPHYTGENGRRGGDRLPRHGASMRPPHYTGENPLMGLVGNVDIPASMRPPHYTGENQQFAMSMREMQDSFNEAPALHGGKPE